MRVIFLILMVLLISSCGGIASKDNINKISSELKLNEIQTIKLKHLLHSYEDKLYDFDKEKKRLKLRLSDMVGEDKFDKVLAKKRINESMSKMQSTLDDILNDTEKFYDELDIHQKREHRKIIKKFIDDQSGGLI